MIKFSGHEKQFGKKRSRLFLPFQQLRAEKKATITETRIEKDLLLHSLRKRRKKEERKKERERKKKERDRKKE